MEGNFEMDESCISIETRNLIGLPACGFTIHRDDFKLSQVVQLEFAYRCSCPGRTPAILVLTLNRCVHAVM